MKTKEYPDLLTVRRPFEGAGEQWKAGARLPWKDLNVTPIRVSRLISSGYLYEPGKEPEIPVEPEKKKTVKKKAATKKKGATRKRKKRTPSKAG